MIMAGTVIYDVTRMNRIQVRKRAISKLQNFHAISNMLAPKKAKRTHNTGMGKDDG